MVVWACVPQKKERRNVWVRFFVGTNHMLCKMSSSWGMCTSKNKKNEMPGYVFDEYKLYVVQKSGSLSMCTSKNKKNEMSGYIFNEYKLYVV